MKRLLASVLLSFVLIGCSKDEPKPVLAECSTPCALVSNVCDRICELESSGCRVSARRLNVRGLSAKDFRAELEACPGNEVHVWMPGERDWLLVSRLETNRTALAECMDRFAADTNCTASVAEVFASYAGTREDILPAFESRLKGDVLPEWFVTKDVPKLEWLDTSDIDDDILKPTMVEIRSVQVVRREILRGNMLAAKATDKKGEEAATEVWARAALRNPNDPMLLERLENLSRNAKGFLDSGQLLQAMKCYETIILIKPRDVVAVHNFGMCLKKIGKTDLAEKVLERAKRLSEQVAQ